MTPPTGNILKRFLSCQTEGGGGEAGFFAVIGLKYVILLILSGIYIGICFSVMILVDGPISKQ